MTRVLLLCPLLLLSTLGAAPPGPAPDPSPRIHSIVIEGNTRTRTEVIRRELLFSVGDRLDSGLVSETARNLRRLWFLGNVQTQVRRDDQGAAVLVRVEDLYSRALSPVLSGEIDELSYGLVALDYNFLGRGQTAQLTVDHQAISGSSLGAYYHVPRMLGSRQALTTRLAAGEEGHELRLTCARPLYALAARWAYGVSAYSLESVQRLYGQQDLVARYRDRLDGASVWLTHSRGDRIKYRPSLRLALTDHRFAASAPYTYTPEDRRRLLPSVGLTIWEPRYEEARFVHALGRTEDLQVGSWVSLGAGFSHPALGADESFGIYQVQLSPRFKPTPDGYAFGTLYANTRVRRSGYYDLFALAEVRAYLRVRRIHSLALRLRWDAVSRPEDHAQLLLGALRGLRGYPARRFDGTRRLLLNLEARPTLYRHPFCVVAGALFVDAGTAWTPGDNAPGLKPAVGAGLRAGLPRVYSSPILRADLAWGISDGAGQVFFGIGQYF